MDNEVSIGFAGDMTETNFAPNDITTGARIATVLMRFMEMVQ